MILIKSRPGRQKPTKRQVKERCRNRSKRTQRRFLHVYCLKDITRQRDSEFDTLHATDPARKPRMQNPEVIAPKGAELCSPFHLGHIII